MRRARCAALFQSGADGPLTYRFAGNAVATLQAQGLTSGGVALSYSVVRQRADGARPARATRCSRSRSTAATGAWTFNLEDQLDHPTLDGLPGDNTENDLTIISGR